LHEKIARDFVNGGKVAEDKEIATLLNCTEPEATLRLAAAQRALRALFFQI